MKGLIIKEKWLNLILDGKKTWEIRNFNTLKIKEKIFLIMSGSKKIYGECVIKESIKVDKEVLLKNLDKHQISKDAISSLGYKNPHAWVLSDVKRFSSPRSYDHKKGCVIWVNI
jgi:hypothetical protein